MTPRDDHKDEPRKPQPDTHCPICKQPVSADATAFPFCSPRCRQIDLGKWLNGDYVVSRPIEQSDLDES
jgi:uncharacterized protein